VLSASFTFATTRAARRLQRTLTGLSQRQTEDLYNQFCLRDKPLRTWSQNVVDHIPPSPLADSAKAVFEQSNISPDRCLNLQVFETGRTSCKTENIPKAVRDIEVAFCKDRAERSEALLEAADANAAKAWAERFAWEQYGTKVRKQLLNWRVFGVYTPLVLLLATLVHPPSASVVAAVLTICAGVAVFKQDVAPPAFDTAIPDTAPAPSPAPGIIPATPAVVSVCGGACSDGGPHDKD